MPCGFFAGDTQVTFDATVAVAPASTGVPVRVFTVPVIAGGERDDLVPVTGRVFSCAVHERFLTVQVTFTVLDKSSSVDAASTTSVTTSSPDTPVTVPASAQRDANTSLVPSPAGTAMLFSSLIYGDFSASRALSTKDD